MKCYTLPCYEDIALSDKAILDLLDNKVNIVLYPNLYKYHNIDEVIGPYEASILLFEAKPSYGHWCALFKVDNNTIEFFDPYGMATTGGYPDDNLKLVPQDFAKVTNQEIPYLSLLLAKSPYDLTYNEFQFQKRNKKIRTCGRHCVFRLMNRDQSLYQYKDMMDLLRDEFKTDYDGVVTIFTI
jgi:hypothetical protein